MKTALKLSCVAAAAALPLLAGTASAQNAPSLRLFSQNGFAGTSLRLDRSVDNLSGRDFNDKAASMIAEGRWEVCLDANYAGTCRVIQGRISDMGDWAGKVSSARYLGPSDWGSSGMEDGATATSLQATASAGTPATQVAAVTPQYRTDYEPHVIGNIYDTDFGAMTLDRWDRDGAAGHYVGASPEASGSFDGIREIGNDSPEGIDRILGYWYQPAAAQACSTQKNGTYYWGQIQFNFSRDRNEFIGFWGHCEGTTLDRWNGTFVRRDPQIAAAVDADLRIAGTSGATAPTTRVGDATAPATGTQPPPAGQPLPGAVDRTVRAAGDEIERRTQDKIREGIGRLF